jgi:pimeloyl-ACP methyl ester carboxylesterase
MASRPRHPGLHDARGAELPHRLLDVRGVETFLYDAGDGPAIVLIHGYGDTADGWRRVVPGLLDSHRVVALDVPPFGRSGLPPERRLLDFYKPFFAELFERLEIESATLIGHSLGGAISLHVGLDQPLSSSGSGSSRPPGSARRRRGGGTRSPATGSSGAPRSPCRTRSRRC